MSPRAVFVSATRQHVGKTTTSLALLACTKKLLKGGEVGFMKPVGQRHVIVEQNLKVDKDVVLFKEYFSLDRCSYQDMSPVVIPAGYTKDFIDGKITEEDQIRRVKHSFAKISAEHDYVIVEGTGHAGVGAIVELNNARVAHLLKIPVLFVVNGGLGSAFDELSLNRLACKEYDVPIKGVIVNKVRLDKVEQTRDYFGRALQRWGMPLLGVVPDGPYLSQPSMLDFEQLFDTTVVCGRAHLLRHFDEITLVAMDLRRFFKRLRTEKHSKTLFVTHASRLDVVLGFVSHARVHESVWGEPFRAGLILAGGGDVDQKERDSIVEAIRPIDCTVLFSNANTYDTLQQLQNYTAKLSAMDPKRTSSAIEHYSPHIDIARIVG
jgi:BioD-like phosphotransacetylase family protein